MKKLFIIPILSLSCLLGACNYLNVDEYFEDTFSEKKIFESQYNIERYFNGAVTMLPKEGRMYYWCSV
ncbi:MAG: RagB/SusD family nutrient uptake outer membrane protein, partial [Alistipes sp.]